MAIKQLEPYVNDITEQDAVVEKINLNKTDIGANSAGMPKMSRNDMGLQHVGTSVGGARG